MTTITEVRIFDTEDKVFNAIAKEILHLTQNSKQACFDIALSGGTSPKGLFNEPSEKNIRFA